MSDEIEGDDGEERAAMVAVKIIDVGFEVVDLLAAFDERARCETDGGEAFDEPRERHDAARGGEADGKERQHGERGDEQQRVVRRFGQVVGREHDARAAQDEEDDREVVEQVVDDERRNAVAERHTLA